VTLRLIGKRVVLRDFAMGDVDDVAAIVGDPRVTATLSFEPRSRDQAEAMIAGVLKRIHDEPRTEYYLAVTRPDVDAVVGFCRLEVRAHQAAKLGVAIHADHWHQGLASDACRTALDFGFGPALALHRITAAIGPDNSASLRLVAHLGFTFEGRLREHVFTHDAWRDSLLYSVLVHEWKFRR
jgi:ribosomal-protein-alanine N-acetyltransferase